MNIKSKINYVFKKENKIKANASVFIDDVIEIRDVKVIDGQKGLFVSMPQSSYMKDDTMRYKDIVAISNDDLKATIEKSVLSAYEAALSEDQKDELPFDPTM